MSDEKQINPYATLIKVGEDYMKEFLYGNWKPEFIKENYEILLDQAGRSCTSGSVIDWPQLKPACAWAIEEIRKLREELKK